MNNPKSVLFACLLECLEIFPVGGMRRNLFTLSVLLLIEFLLSFHDHGDEGRKKGRSLSAHRAEVDFMKIQPKKKIITRESPKEQER